jgi:hypothetical protein
VSVASPALVLHLAELRLLREGAETLWRGGQLRASWALVSQQLAAVASVVDAGLRELAPTLSQPQAEELGAIATQLKQLQARAPAVRLEAPEPSVLLSAFELIDQWSCAVERRVAPRPRWRRWLLPGAAVLALGALFVAWRLQPSVRASASRSGAHAASQAVDGIEATEWLLPDAATGWLELRFPFARDVSLVRLRNSANLPYRDRGTRAFRLELLSESEQLASERKEFPEFRAGTDGVDTWLEVPIRASGVTRVRVSVESHYGLGGGLAELSVL